MVKIEERVAERVMKEVARIFKKDASELTRDTRFVEDLLAKSVHFVELTAILEYEFGIAIPLAKARRAKTVGDIISLLKK